MIRHKHIAGLLTCLPVGRNTGSFTPKDDLTIFESSTGVFGKTDDQQPADYNN